MKKTLRDDSFSIFNLNKKITEEFSLIKIFHDNNLLYQIYNQEIFCLKINYLKI